MADGDVMIASAIIIPDSIEDVAPATSKDSPSLKRRQSESPDTEPSKRARRSSEERSRSPNDILSRRNSTANGAHGSPPTGPNSHESRSARNDRRQTGREEERVRGKRMFGAILGALSGAPSGRGSAAGVQKRRADIEKRAQAKLRQMDEVGRQRQQEMSEQVRRRRRREQWIFDEEAMRTRHDGLLDSARCLATKTRPKLYYKPWELLPEEEDIISRQIEDTEDRIDREVDEFEYRRSKALQELDEIEERDKLQSTSQSKDEFGDMSIDRTGPGNSMSNRDPTTTFAADAMESEIKASSTPALTTGREMEAPQEEMMDEHHGETVVEAEEDTVIY